MHDHDPNCPCGNHHEAHETKIPDEMWDENDVPLPDPTLMSLISGLASQVMLSLGAFPNPITGKSTIMLHQAKHLIDTIAMLFEKTAGNQTDEEKQKIDALLHELRMIFVAAQNEKKRREGE